MNSYKSCPAFDLETGERRTTNQNAPRRFKFTGAKSTGPDDSNRPTNGAKMTNNNNNKLQTQKSNVALLSDEDLGISTSSFKPRFPVVVNENKKSSSSSISSPSSSSSSSSMSLGSVKMSAVDGLPSARLGRDGKFLGNYSHNFRNDEVRTKKDWWSPK